MQTVTQTTEPQLEAATVRGTVSDDDGAAVPGAQVTLELSLSSTRLVATTDAAGRFVFAKVPPGAFRVTAAAAGFASEDAKGTVQAGELRDLPPIELPVATMTDEVSVTVSKHDIAEEEMKVEETQRVLGFLPNFYVVYDWHAVPLSTRQKYRLAFHVLYDPASIAIVGLTAGIQQGTDGLAGYGPGPGGYARRFGANYANFVTGSLLSGAVLPALLHQDPRYFYKGTGTIRARFFYALAAAVVAKGDNGKWQPNYSSVLGDLASGAISNAYYPASDQTGAGLTLANGALDIAEQGLGNLVEEFVFRHLTPHAPSYGSTTAVKAPTELKRGAARAEMRPSAHDGPGVR